MRRRPDGSARTPDSGAEIDVLLDELDEAFAQDAPTERTARERRDSTVRPSSSQPAAPPTRASHRPLPRRAPASPPPLPPSSAAPPADPGAAASAAWAPAPTPQVSQQAAVAMLEFETLRHENTRLWELVRVVREVRRLEDLFERRGGRQSEHRAFIQARNRLDAMLVELLGG